MHVPMGYKRYRLKMQPTHASAADDPFYPLAGWEEHSNWSHRPLGARVASILVWGLACCRDWGPPRWYSNNRGRCALGLEVRISVSIVPIIVECPHVPPWPVAPIRVLLPSQPVDEGGSSAADAWVGCIFSLYLLYPV